MSWIEKMQSAPKGTRQAAAFSLSAIFAGAVFLGWLVTFDTSAIAAAGRGAAARTEDSALLSEPGYGAHPDGGPEISINQKPLRQAAAAEGGDGAIAEAAELAREAAALLSREAEKVKRYFSRDSFLEGRLEVINEGSNTVILREKTR